MIYEIEASIRVPVVISVEANSKDEAIEKAEKGLGWMDPNLSNWSELKLETP